jgi:hypothetical protein
MGLPSMLLLGSHGVQASIEVGGAIARQNLVLIRSPGALTLPELFGSPLLGSLAVFGSDLGGVHEPLRPRCGNGEQRNHHQGKDRFQMSLLKK